MSVYKSCEYIQTGLNFYPNNIAKLCCFTEDDAVNCSNILQPAALVTKNIFLKKSEAISRFKSGDIYECCKSCPVLKEKEWSDQLLKIKNITLNHFMFCNLKCSHCGYVEGVENGKYTDSNDDKIIEIIDFLIKNDYVVPDLTFDVGGGEPSVSVGLEKIIRYVYSGGFNILINSNGAKYSELFSEGLHNGLLTLILTPDAGSRSVYKEIKGRDNFVNAWKNIKKYHDIRKGNVKVKFILQEKNKNDIQNMVEMCRKSGVKVVQVSLDLNTHPSAYAEFKTKIKELIDSSLQAGLSVERALIPVGAWPY